MDALIQFLFAGLTEGSRYALAALGFTLIYNASGAINFAQGESIMLGGMIAAVLTAARVPLPVAIAIAVLIAIAVNLLLLGLFARVLARSGVLEVIILTVAFGIVLRGLAHVLWGTQTRSLPAFTSGTSLRLGGAAILPQVLWVIGLTALALVALSWFFHRSRTGRGFIAAALDPSTAQLMGIDVRAVLMLAFGLSAVLGALGGIVTAPITYTYYDVGVIVGLKAIIAAIIGGIGSTAGAVVGGFAIGLAEALTAGYVSSAYKDAVPFAMVVLLFLVRPHGLFGRPRVERV